MRRVTEYHRSASPWRNTRQRCDCGGYHFPHRRTGGACHHGPRSDYYLALRAGLSASEALLTLAVHILELMP